MKSHLVPCALIVGALLLGATAGQAAEAADAGGPAVWRGGFNSALLNSTNNLYLNTECGINRVAIRSTLTPGTITLTATRASLTPASVQIESRATEITGCLETDPPQAYSGLAEAILEPVP